MTVPEGWQLVPKDGTKEMLDAMQRVWRERDDYDGLIPWEMWKAALAAAPAAPDTDLPTPPQSNTWEA